MGKKEFMLKQITQKLEEGFSCLKLKIGAIKFDEEISVIKSIRNKFSSDSLEIRVDANGAFKTKDWLLVLAIGNDRLFEKFCNVLKLVF